MNINHVSSVKDTWYLGRLTMDSDVFKTCSYNKCISKYKFTWDDGEYLNEKIQESHQYINLRFEVDGEPKREKAIFGCTFFGSTEEAQRARASTPGGARDIIWILM